MNGVSQLASPTRLPVAERVKLTFHQSCHARLRSVSVVDVDGTIVLTGQVPSYYLKQVAQVMASAVDGVRRLDNRTVVAPSEDTLRLSGATRERRAHQEP